MRGAFRRRDIVIGKTVASGNPDAKPELLGTTGPKTPARFAIAQFR
jgi:hypothetical protein